MKILVSLTTSPKRISLLKNTINSILKQTVQCSKIILNIPEKFGRTNEYYDIPDFIKSNPKIYINRTKKDIGPIMKLVPTLFLIKKLKYDNCYIITIDDDIVYLPHMIEIYLNYIKKDKYMVFGISGFNFGLKKEINPISYGSCVDILEGYGSIIYNYDIFDLKDFKKYLSIVLRNKYCKFSDDLIISNYLELNNIKKVLINEILFNRKLLWDSSCILEYGNSDDALHNGAYPECLFNNDKRYILALEYLKRKNQTYF